MDLKVFDYKTRVKAVSHRIDRADATASKTEKWAYLYQAAPEWDSVTDLEFLYIRVIMSCVLLGD